MEWSRRGTIALADDQLGQAVLMRRRTVECLRQSGFAGSASHGEVIVLAVRWYLRYGVSYRDVKELLAERGVVVDHIYRSWLVLMVTSPSAHWNVCSKAIARALLPSAPPHEAHPWLVSPPR